MALSIVFLVGLVVLITSGTNPLALSLLIVGAAGIVVITVLDLMRGDPEWDVFIRATQKHSESDGV